MVKSPVPICRSVLLGILIPDVEDAVNRILPPFADIADCGGRPNAELPSTDERNGILYIGFGF